MRIFGKRDLFSPNANPLGANHRLGLAGCFGVSRHGLKMRALLPAVNCHGVEESHNGGWIPDGNLNVGLGKKLSGWIQRFALHKHPTNCLKFDALFFFSQWYGPIEKGTVKPVKLSGRIISWHPLPLCGHGLLKHREQPMKQRRETNVQKIKAMTQLYQGTHHGRLPHLLPLAHEPCPVQRPRRAVLPEIDAGAQPVIVVGAGLQSSPTETRCHNIMVTAVIGHDLTLIF